MLSIKIKNCIETVSLVITFLRNLSKIQKRTQILIECINEYIPNWPKSEKKKLIKMCETR